jgi:hypothetical protein
MSILLIDSFLGHSPLSRGSPPPEVCILDLRSLVRDLDLGRLLRGNAGLILDFVETPCLVRANPGPLRTAVAGLVAGASRTVGARGTVLIRIDRRFGAAMRGGSLTDGVRLEISDSVSGERERFALSGSPNLGLGTSPLVPPVVPHLVPLLPRSLQLHPYSRHSRPLTARLSPRRNMGPMLADGFMERSIPTSPLSRIPGHGTTARMWIPSWPEAYDLLEIPLRRETEGHIEMALFSLP